MNEHAPDKVFRIPMPVRWSDLDAFNHVNNARYLTFLEQARIEWFETIGERWVTDEYAPVLVSSLLNYKRPIEYPASVFVELFTEKLGNSSVVIGHRILGDDGVLYCDGQVAAVWVDRHTGKPRPLPAGVRRASELLLESASAG